MLSRFHIIPERYGQTDRETDKIRIHYINIARQYADKNLLQSNIRLIKTDRTQLVDK